MRLNNLTKLYMILTLLFLGVGAYLGLSILNSNTSQKTNPTKAADNWVLSGGSCRTVGTDCADAEFPIGDPRNDRGLLDDNQMFYCRNFITCDGDVYGWGEPGSGKCIAENNTLWPDGHYYGTTEVDVLSCGATCEGKSGLIEAGTDENNSTCNNPFRCPAPVVAQSASCDDVNIVGDFALGAKPNMIVKTQGAGGADYKFDVKVTSTNANGYTYTQGVEKHNANQLFEDTFSLPALNHENITQDATYTVTTTKVFGPANTTISPSCQKTFKIPGSNPTTGSVSVKSRCEDGDPNGKTFKLRVDIANIKGQEFGQIPVGSAVTVDGIDNSKFPVQINPTASEYAPLEVLSNSCSNGSGSTFPNGGSCEIVFKNCGETPPPPPGKSQVKVESKCVDGSGDVLNVPFNTSKGNGTTTQTITYDGESNVDVEIGSLPNSIKEKYPNISFKDSLVNGSDAQNLTKRNVVKNSTVTYEYQNCTSVVKQPKIKIEKKLVTANPHKKGDTAKFKIVVTNISTDNSDIVNFDLTDNFDPNYLEFIKSSYNGNNLPPLNSNPTPVNGRVTLEWKDLPPGNAVLMPGEQNAFVLLVEFKVKADNTNNLKNNRDNDNCGIVTKFQYKDNSNQVVEKIVNLESCDEVIVKDQPTNLTVDITKETITKVTMQGSNDLIVFKSVITNNSKENYTDIDFIDNYDSAYIQIKNVKVTKIDAHGNVIRTEEITNLSKTSPLKISDLQSLFGELRPGERLVFELKFLGIKSANSTCDEVSTSVTDKNDNNAKDTAEACAQINPPIPPKTGANFILNFVLPSIAFVGSIGVRRYLV